MSNKKTVFTKEERKAQLLAIGARLAAKYGAANVTRRMVAKEAKCAEALVSVYMGGTDRAQSAYARKAKALGYSLPDKATTATIGAKLRAHGPRDKRDTRKRSVKEVEAIKRKSAARGPGYTVKTKTLADGRTIVNVKATRKGVDLRKVGPLAEQRETKPAAPPKLPTRKPASKPLVTPGEAPKPPERKATAARAPKAPPSLPLPTAP